MRIIKVIIEAADPIGVNTVVGNHIKDPNMGKGDNKTIIGANTKATADNLIPPMEAILIITMAIIKAGCGHGRNHLRPCGHRRGNYRGHNNYQYHQYYTHDDGSQYGPPCTLCGGFNHSPKHC